MITGSIVALVTPMAKDGSIDWKSLDKLVDWHIEMGTSAIVPVGTTGESVTVTPQEHCDVIRAVVVRVDGRIPVIAGTGSNSTQEAIDYTQSAKASGADACLLVTPYYNKPTQEGLYLHHKAIAEAVDLPQVLYNVPGRTACDMLPETVARIAELPQVFAIKEATGDIQRTRDILKLCGERLTIFSGDDATARELMLTGAKGTISVTANVAPRQMADMCAAAISGDAEEAARLDAPLALLHDDLFVEANPIPVKWALAEMGRIDSGIRLPMTTLSEQYHERLRAALRHAGALN